MKDGGFSTAHAKILGTHLNLPRATIKTLKNNNADDANGLLYDIIDSWLDQTEPGLWTNVTAEESLENVSFKLRASLLFEGWIRVGVYE